VKSKAWSVERKTEESGEGPRVEWRRLHARSGDGVPHSFASDDPPKRCRLVRTRLRISGHPRPCCARRRRPAQSDSFSDGLSRDGRQTSGDTLGEGRPIGRKGSGAGGIGFASDGNVVSNDPLRSVDKEGHSFEPLGRFSLAFRGVASPRSEDVLEPLRPSPPVYRRWRWSSAKRSAFSRSC